MRLITKSALARERILEAACDLIAGHGVDDVRIARVAQTAGVSSALIHYHFETREALLAEALEHSYELAGDIRVRAAEEGPPERSWARQVADMVDQCLPWPGVVERDWKLWLELWLQAARQPELRPVSARLNARIHDWLAETITAGVAAGEFSDCDVHALTTRALLVLDGAGVRALLGDPAMTLADARREVGAVLAEGLGLPEGNLPFAEREAGISN